MRGGEPAAANAAADMIGRDAELGELRALLREHGPRIAHVHGLPGIGKSTLLRHFLTEARDRGLDTVLLDCREIEPTPAGFLAALGDAIGAQPATPAVVAERLGALRGPAVLALDTFEVFRLLDTWLRLDFVPRLASNVRVMLVGRHRPVAGWLAAGWTARTLTLALGPLTETDAAALLVRGGLNRARCRIMAEDLCGHPLALRLAASTLGAHQQLGDASLQRVMDTLAAMYLEEIDDPALRRIIEGTAVIRRATVPLLGDMFPDSEPEQAYDQLKALPFTEIASDGLRLHEAVRDAVAQTLRARDPQRYLEYRCEAWRALVNQSTEAARPDLWRYTADMLYLIENPVCREAFFPSGATELTVEHPRPGDFPAIRGIARAHEERHAATCLDRWLTHHPDAFVVVRNPDHVCEGFCCRFDPAAVDAALLVDDPVTAAWHADLQDHPLPSGQRALFVRRWLARDCGEHPGPVQAAAWLDLKRIYMEMRPRLRRVYLTVTDLTPYAAVAAELGFRVCPEQACVIGDRRYHAAVLDFGPDSVDGWLAELAASELGLKRPADILDRQARELVCDGRRVPLTPLEFGVMAHLREHAGQAVSRDALLLDVWGSAYTGWSNKVDAVIAALRRKLGDQADRIETVTGVGYRYRK